MSENIQIYIAFPQFFFMSWILQEKTWKNRVLYDTNGL